MLLQPHREPAVQHVRLADTMEDLGAPVLDACRRLWRNRGISLTVILSLGIGIGANTAIFTLVDTIFLEPLAVKNPNEIVAVAAYDPSNPQIRAFSVPNFRDLWKRQRVFENLAIAGGVDLNADTGAGVHRAQGQLVSSEFFATTGVEPLLGGLFKDLIECDWKPGDPYPVVVSHSFWKRELQGDPSAVGRVLLLNKNKFRIRGVMPPGFRGFTRMGSPDMWLPISSYRLFMERAHWFESRRAIIMQVFARLKPGVTWQQAEADVDRIGREFAQAYPEENAGRTVRLFALDAVTIGPRFREQLIQMALLLMTASAIVLLIAVANVGNALLARASVRRREMAVRLALGARPRQILLQVFWDSAVLVAAGGAFGLLLGCLGRNLLWNSRPEEIFSDQSIPQLNWRILLFVAALSVVTGMLANVLPLMQTLRGNIIGELRERAGAMRRSLSSYRLRELLVISQVALSMVSLVAADFFLKSLRNVERVDPGFEVRSLAALGVNPRSLGIPSNDRFRFLADLRDKIASLDKVQSVAISGYAPFQDDGMRRTIVSIESTQPKGGPALRVNAVSERFFETTDILILRGRDFSPKDDRRAPAVVIVNEAMVRRYWPSESPIGKKFRFYGDLEDRTVVGVARDITNRGLREPPEASVFAPIYQESITTATLNIRTQDDAASVQPAIERELRAFRSDLPVELVLASKAVPEELWGPRATASLLAIAGILALILAAIGVYGITAHLVTRRTGEIGVRMAMGACPVDVMELVLSQCVRLILPGLAIGIVVSFGIARLFGNMLFSVSQMDLEAYLFTSILLAVVALLASYVPARRVTRMTPMLALRHD